MNVGENDIPVLRIHQGFRDELRPMLEKIVPEKLTKNADRAIGLPVRGSDKCGKPVTGDG